jgi:diguanylate cyclase (GGDEF)-like protein/PAS domain S-box-containing protein
MASSRTQVSPLERGWTPKLTAVSWSRVPHEFILALIFSLIAIGVAAAIVKTTTTDLGRTDDEIGYATTELQGIRYFSRTHTVLHELLDYRAEVVATGWAPSVRTTAISASIASIRDRSGAQDALAAGIADQLGTLRKRWSSISRRHHVAPDDVSAVVTTIQPLLSAISGASGISNDSSIDGINFADAIVRFPLSLARGSEAASIAAVNLAAGNGSLSRRFEAARLLAQAQTAIEIGRQDAADEMSVDPRAGAPLSRRTAVNSRDFQTMMLRVTDRYVQPRRSLRDRTIVTALQTFTLSSVAVIDTLRDDLFRVTSARIAQARRQKWQLLAGAISGVAVELLTMLTLAWVSIVNFQNQRKRMTAEHIALESQRASLEARLTQTTAQAALLRTKAQFRAVFDRAPTGMIIVDRQCNIIDTNEAAESTLKTTDKVISALSVVTDQATVIAKMFAGEFDRYSEEREYVVEADNRSRWFNISISPVHDESGEALFAILMIWDITDNKSTEAQLVFEAGHDALTGLPNRKRFFATLQQALDNRARDNRSGVFSVVFVDFNNFKTINDSFGHQVGDKFLIEGAARLTKGVRSTDFVARIGGDEFAVLLYATDRCEIENAVARLQALVSVPVNIDGQLVTSSASFGIAEAESRYTLAAELVRDADTAMYQAKASATQGFVVFELGMHEGFAAPHTVADRHCARTRK